MPKLWHAQQGPAPFFVLKKSFLSLLNGPGELRAS